MAIVVSKASVGDIRAIRRLEQRVWREPGVSSTYGIAVMVRFGYAFVAKDKGKVVGALLATKTRDDCIYVEDWAVDRAYRSQGIGMRLYKALFRAAHGLPVVTFIHPDMKASLKAHRKMGFRTVKKVKDPYGRGEKVSRLFVRRG